MSKIHFKFQLESMTIQQLIKVAKDFNIKNIAKSRFKLIHQIFNHPNNQLQKN